jgi:hypothetical protein
MAAPAYPVVGATGTQFLSRQAAYFPDPFDDMASAAMPRSMPVALLWAQSIHMLDGTYRQAMDRVCSYFLTEIEIKGPKKGDKKISRDEKLKYENFLRKTIKIRGALHASAIDYLCYGNSFTSILVPFRRYLMCKGCSAEFPLGRVYNTPAFKFQWTNFEFHAKCPNCGYKGAWPHIDRRGGEESELKIKRWSPHEIEILFDPISDSRAYIWKIPEIYRKMVREGKLYHLERAPWEVVQAIKNGNHLMFDPDVVHHLYDPQLSGIETGGWGISKAVTNFRQAWYCQVLRRMNEAIAQDFIIPFRVITPEPKSGADGASSDPVLGMNLGRFNSQVQAMLRRHRKDPAGWNILPFPIAYQALGGEANQLAPFQLIDQSIDQLLNAAGVPAELYKGTLSLQAALPALRLFESHWSFLVDNLNQFLDWAVDRVAKVLNWEPVDCRLTKVRIADDMNRSMALLQLMMGRQISQSSGLKSLDLDFEDEQERMLEEEAFVQQRTQQLQEELQGQADQGGGGSAAAGAAGGGAPPGAPPGAAGGAGAPPGAAGGAAGGAPPGGGAGAAPPSQQPTDPNKPVTPQELLSKAQAIAGQIQAMPETQRTSEMINLKKMDPTLHALVKAQVDDQRQQAQTAGGAQLLAQTYPKSAGALLTSTPEPPRPSMSASDVMRALRQFPGRPAA